MPPSFSVSVGEPNPVVGAPVIVVYKFSLGVSEITTVLPASTSFELAVAVAPVMVGAKVSTWMTAPKPLAGRVPVKAWPARSAMEAPVGRLSFVTVSSDVFWPVATV